jgi:hypothetical protein
MDIQLQINAYRQYAQAAQARHDRSRCQISCVIALHLGCIYVKHRAPA